jgi:hypothetical protein
MMLASKYEEIYPPEVRDFVYICDNAYTRDQVYPPARLDRMAAMPLLPRVHSVTPRTHAGSLAIL